MPRIAACALVALVLVSITAHAARNDRILLILPGDGDWRDEVLTYWNDGVGLDVDIVVDPALGTALEGPDKGMLGVFGQPVPEAEWAIVRVEEPGELEDQLEAMGDGAEHIAAMGPAGAFDDTPAEAYAKLDGVFVTTPALPDGGERAAFLARLRIVATQANEAKPGMLIGVSLEPAADEENPLLPAHKLFEDTRDLAGIFAVDVDALGIDGIALVESVATASPPRARGMYVDMMQRPENILDPAKERWMQWGVMILGAFTILGVFLIVRFKRPPDHSPPNTG